MARFKREKFDKDKPLVAIRALTLNGESYELGDLLPMDLPEGLRKKMWKARRAVHEGAPLRGKSTPTQNASTVKAKTPVDKADDKAESPKKAPAKRRGRPPKKDV